MQHAGDKRWMPSYLVSTEGALFAVKPEIVKMVYLLSGRSSTQSPDLRSMLESYDFDGLFLFLDPIVN